MKQAFRRQVVVSVAVAATGLLSASALAADWNQSAAGSYNWTDANNWTPAGSPTGVGAVANLTNDISGTVTINMAHYWSDPANPVTLGTLNLGDSDAATAGTFSISWGGLFICDTGDPSTPAQLSASTAGSSYDTISSGFQLNSDLAINTPRASTALRLKSLISDGVDSSGNPVSHGLIKNGPGYLLLALDANGSDNTYTGLTAINGGQLRVESGGGHTLIPANIQINNGATLRDWNANGNVIADTANLDLNNGYYNPQGANETIGSLEGAGQNSEIGCTGRSVITFGGNNQDKTYNGVFEWETSFTKVGTGVQILSGPRTSETTSGGTWSTFSVLGGAVYLAKDAGLAAIANRNLAIGNGSQSGTSRPEVRLLQDEQINVSYGGVSHEQTAATMNSGVLNINGHTETIGTLAVSGSMPSAIDRGTGGKLVVANGMTVNDGVTAEIKGSAGGVLRTNGLNLNSSGKLDVGTNKVIVHGGNVATIEGQLAAGRNAAAGGIGDGSWDGSHGIVSSTAAAAFASEGIESKAVGLGVSNSMPMGDPTVPGTSTPVFSGAADGDVLLRYTYNGDATLDGVVDDFDVIVVGALYDAGASSGHHWYEGDFNGDGKIDDSDVILLGAFYAPTAPVLSDASLTQQYGAEFAKAFEAGRALAVPEPATLSLLGVGVLGLLTQRRRQAR